MRLEIHHYHHQPDQAIEQKLGLILMSLRNLGETIMSTLTDFFAKQAAFNDRQGAAIDTVVAASSGLTDDVKALNDKITALQNSSGTVSPEDQATIDDLETKGEALTARSEAVAAALAALDAQTPPAAPPAG